jgi:hypothetical protein
MEISIVTPPGHSGAFTVGSREQGRWFEGLPQGRLKLLDEYVTASVSCVNGDATGGEVFRNSRSVFRRRGLG